MKYLAICRFPACCRWLIVALAGLHSAPLLLAQGPLAPPGAPAPTMKTLQQVEPRIDLQNAPAAAVDTTNSGIDYVILKPGSYYLSANVSAIKGNCIWIDAAGVTLDLNGFEISRGGSGSVGTGVVIGSPADGASIRNGSINGTFQYGINSNSLVTSSCALRDLVVSGCVNYGIRAGTGSVIDSCLVSSISGGAGVGIFSFTGSTLRNCSVSLCTVNHAIRIESSSSLENCSADGNIASVAISLGSGCSLSHVTADGNTVEWGIRAGTGSNLNHCSATGNTSGENFSGGIYTDGRCTVIHCNANGNLNTSTPSPTTGMGICADTGSTVESCTASGNKGRGVSVGTGVSIHSVTAEGNGTGTGTGEGISAGESASVVDCNAYNNRGDGIVVSNKSTISGCTVAGNLGRGIYAGIGASIQRVTADINVGQGIVASESASLLDCNVYSNGGDGIMAGIGSTISGCTARANGGDGIEVPNDCFVTRNHCTANGSGSGVNDGAGIHSTSAGNRIDDNSVVFNDIGIKVDGPASIIIRNTARFNTAGGYNIAAGNQYGPIVAPPAGTPAANGVAASTLTTTDPFANFLY